MQCDPFFYYRALQHKLFSRRECISVHSSLVVTEQYTRGKGGNLLVKAASITGALTQWRKDVTMIIRQPHGIINSNNTYVKRYESDREHAIYQMVMQLCSTAKLKFGGGKALQLWDVWQIIHSKEHSNCTHSSYSCIQLKNLTSMRRAVNYPPSTIKIVHWNAQGANSQLAPASAPRSICLFIITSQKGLTTALFKTTIKIVHWNA